MSIDTLHVSFVIEKDGHIDQFEIPGDVNTQLKDAIFAALAQFDGWSPEKLYGVPFRTQIISPLKEISGYNGNSYLKEIFYREKIIR